MIEINTQPAELYKSLFENSYSVMLIIDPETGQIFDANKAACNYYGYSKQQLKNSLIDDINTLSKAQIQEELRKAERDDRNYFNFTHRLANGEIRDVEVFTGPLDIAGKTYLYSIIHDISDRRKVREALEQSENRFRRLFEESSDAIAFIEDGVFSDCNTALLEHLGSMERSDFIGKTPADLSPEYQPDGKKSSTKAAEIIKNVMKHGNTRFEWLHHRQNGEEFYVDVNLTRVYEHEKQIIHCIWRDITEQKKLEEQLTNEREQLTSIFDSIDEVVYISDPITYEILYVNKPTKKLFGAKIVGEKCYEKLQGKQSPCDFCTNAIILNKKYQPYKWEYYNPTIDRYFSVTDRIIKWPDGRDLRFELAVDVTELKNAQLALHQNEERYRTTLDHMIEGFQIIGFDWRYLYANDMVAKHGRTTKEKLLGRTMMEAYPGIDQTPLFSTLRDCMEKRIPARIENEFAYGENDSAWFQLSIQPAPEGIFIMSMDIGERKQTEKALYESEERLRHFFKYAPAAMAMFDENLRFLAVSKRWIVDYKLEGRILTGKSYYEIFPEVPEDRKEVYRNGLKGKVTKNEEEECKHPDGTSYWLRWEVRPWYRSDETIGGIVILTEDITDRKLAEIAARQSENQFHLIFKNSPLGIYIANNEGVILDCNKSLRDIWGFKTLKEVQGINILKYPAYLENGYASMIQKCIDSNEIIRKELPYLRKGNQELILSNYVIPLSDERGKVQKIFTKIEDITARRKSVEKLKNYTQALERSNQDLQEFAYVASHDLQEPLRMVASFLQLLERKLKDQLDESTKEYINFAVDGAKRMQRMINSLLSYSRLSFRERTLNHVDCNVLLKDVQENLKLLIEENHVVLTIGDLPTVYADQIQLEHVFQNLIENAIKFRNDHDPEIEISAQLINASVEKAAGRRKQVWRFSIKDNGIGILPEHQKRIFKIFNRLNPESGKKGTGIGLAICKKVIERYGGDIWVESQPEAGATFYFTIPAEEKD